MRKNALKLLWVFTQAQLRRTIFTQGWNMARTVATVTQNGSSLSHEQQCGMCANATDIPANPIWLSLGLCWHEWDSWKGKLVHCHHCPPQQMCERIGACDECHAYRHTRSKEWQSVDATCEWRFFAARYCTKTYTALGLFYCRCLHRRKS